MHWKLGSCKENEHSDKALESCEKPLLIGIILLRLWQSHRKVLPRPLVGVDLSARQLPGCLIWAQERCSSTKTFQVSVTLVRSVGMLEEKLLTYTLSLPKLTAKSFCGLLIDTFSSNALLRRTSATEGCMPVASTGTGLLLKPSFRVDPATGGLRRRQSALPTAKQQPLHHMFISIFRRSHLHHRCTFSESSF
ncbi:hypothetical protein VTP01DRAFT_7132 [Rhizomucor pusillus]|uniref:uncharacterized protein n=1 Tax=Rhizomucor pusillus TaxID=4840 RepID=UPI00374430C1